MKALKEFGIEPAPKRRKGMRHHGVFASLINTGSIRSVTENAVITTTFAIRSLSGELSRLASTAPCSATTAVAIRSLSGELFRLTLALCAFVLWVPAGVRADPLPPNMFAWDAPEGCPDRDKVRQTIARWLNESAFPVEASSISVKAEVWRENARWQLALVFKSPSGRAEERLAAKNCETLVEVVGVKVAFAASAAAALQKLDTQAPAPVNPLRGALRATGGVVIGRLPGASATFGLSSSLQFGFARLEVGISYAPPRAAYYREYPEVGADFQLVSASARVCATPALGVAQMPICGGVELGVMHGSGFGSGFGVSRVSNANLLYGEFVLGPALRWPLTGMLFAWLEIDASLAFARPSYYMENIPALLFRPGEVAARSALGVEIEFF